jgi:hypothetical protein
MIIERTLAGPPPAMRPRACSGLTGAATALRPNMQAAPIIVIFDFIFN